MPTSWTGRSPGSPPSAVPRARHRHHRRYSSPTHHSPAAVQRSFWRSATAVNQLRADGFDVRDEDVARLSPFVRQHINMLGRYSFQLPDLPGGMRPLRDPDATDEE